MGGKTIDERFTMKDTKERIEYIKLTEFEPNIDGYLNGNNHTQEQKKNEKEQKKITRKIN